MLHCLIKYFTNVKRRDLPCQFPKQNSKVPPCSEPAAAFMPTYLFDYCREVICKQFCVKTDCLLNQLATTYSITHEDMCINVTGFPVLKNYLKFYGKMYIKLDICKSGIS